MKTDNVQHGCLSSRSHYPRWTNEQKNTPIGTIIQTGINKLYFPNSYPITYRRPRQYVGNSIKSKTITMVYNQYEKNFLIIFEQIFIDWNSTTSRNFTDKSKESIDLFFYLLNTKIMVGSPVIILLVSLILIYYYWKRTEIHYRRICTSSCGSCCTSTEIDAKWLQFGTESSHPVVHRTISSAE